VTTALLRPITMLRGDPAAIRESAGAWHRIGDQCTGWASSVRGCHIGGFIGDEAAAFESHLAGFGDRLDKAAQAWHQGAAALERFADRLETCQRELEWLACQLPSGADRIGGDGVVDAGGDPRMLRRIYDRAGQVWAEHDDSVARCRADLRAAAALLPKAHIVHVSVRGRAFGTTTAGIVRPLEWDSPAVMRSRSWDSPAVMGFRGSPGDLARGHLAGMALRSIAAGLRTVSGTAGLLATTPAVQSPSEFFSEIGELLGIAGLALAVFGSGGGGGLALAGGAGAAVAAPEVATGAAAVVAGVGLGILIASAVKGESPAEVVDGILHPTIGGTPTADMHVIARMNRESLPPDVLKQVDDAIARAKIGKHRFDWHDGKDWENSDGRLPVMPPKYYSEWTAAANGQPRGPYRVIIGGDPSKPDAIYFWDHRRPPFYIGP
jgi:guanyl-specific ribonuclease Sa